ncbi:MAG: ABC transporter permease [Gemmataceae bacterium]
MVWWRYLLLTVLGVLLGLPLLLPLIECGSSVTKLVSPDELSRLFSLAKTTTLLVISVVGISLPMGIMSGLLLFRTDMLGRSLFLFVTGLILFVPLPVFTSAWQAAVGFDGWLLPLWAPRQRQPWAEGLFPAIWVHSLAAIPWTSWIVGSCSLWVERELEEDALLVHPPLTVLLRVTVSRCYAGIICAAIWTALQVVGNIVVTDMFQVRSFAEEVYLVLNQGSEDAVTSAVMVSLPAMFLFWAFLLSVGAYAYRLLPPPLSITRPPLIFSAGQWGWCWLLGLVVLYGFVLLLPIFSLLRQVGIEGSPERWSFSGALLQLTKAARVSGIEVISSFACACIVGVVAGVTALILSSNLARNRYLRWLVFAVLAAIAVLPGPILGIGLKSTILFLISMIPIPFVEKWLYFGPSWVPIGWAYFLRWFPVAFAVVWLAYRSIPKSLTDQSDLDGLSATRRLWSLEAPLTRRAVFIASGVVTALSLGEVSTSKLAGTPGVQTFSMVVFDRMHYGVTQEVAAICLLQLSLVGAMGLCGLVWWGIFRGRQRTKYDLD